MSACSGPPQTAATRRDCARICLSVIPHSQNPPASLSQRSPTSFGDACDFNPTTCRDCASPEMRYWNMARQRYCRRLVRYWRALRLSADRAENAARKPARKPGFLTHEDKVPRETDSPLEGAGFEPSVPRESPVLSGSSPSGRGPRVRRLTGGGGRIRTLGPPSERMYANTEIAADREQWGRRSAEKIWHRCVIGTADHPLRQQPRPRACVCLTGKASRRNGHRHFGSEDPRCRQEFVQTAIFGALVFFW